MTALQLANVLAVTAAGWALWVRRHSFGSRWDGAITVGVALYGLGSALESAWPAVASASYPLTGKYYLLPVLGNISYLAGTAVGLKSFYVRLLPDAEIGRFMRTWIAPVVGLAASVMLLCTLVSPRTSTMPANYLYAVDLDGWLRLYFITYFVSATALLWAAVFGGWRLRDGANSGAVIPLMLIALVGSLACLGHLVATLTGHGAPALALAGGYLATSVTALACGVYWRRRVNAMRGRPPKG
jgi:hypothetical protein